jgi:hypothetical protein
LTHAGAHAGDLPSAVKIEAVGDCYRLLTVAVCPQPRKKVDDLMASHPAKQSGFSRQIGRPPPDSQRLGVTIMAGYPGRSRGRLNETEE